MDIKQEAEKYIKTSTMVSFMAKRHIKNLLKELETTERKLAEAVDTAMLSDVALDTLRNRKGFRHWYDDLDCDIQFKE